MTDKPFVVKLVDTTEHEDGSATYSFDLDEDAQQELCNIGLELVLHCAAYELDIQYVIENIKNMKEDPQYVFDFE